MTTRVVKETATRAVNLHQRRPDPHGDRQYTDDGLAAHVADPDPHTQYTLETDALEVFSFAAYGGMFTSLPQSVGIGFAFETIPFTNQSGIPRNIGINIVANTFSFEVDGVFAVTLSGSFAHDEVNAGREFRIRIWNVTAGLEPGTHPARVFTGRNMAGTNLSITILAEISDAVKGDLFRLEVGGTTDSYALVDWDGEVVIGNVGEWREPLPSDE